MSINRSLLRNIARTASVLAFAACALPALAAIPVSERQALVDLYNSTNGTAWTRHNNWLGAVGTECTWFGVRCDQGKKHVVFIKLDDNHLVGSLPASLNQLTALQLFSVSSNQLTGSIPSLNGLRALHAFDVSVNQLTGRIPALSELTALQIFDVQDNQLTGSIPPLNGLTGLRGFIVANNHLTGSIPTLSGLTALQNFWVSGNQLTGSIPSLSGLVHLGVFHVEKNQLTGSIPALSAQTSLLDFNVSENRLTGTPPAAPASLWPGQSALCPNYLSTPSPTDDAWDKATGGIWSTKCTTAP